MGIQLANLDRIVAAAIALGVAPPPPVDYLAWARANIVFSDRESPFPGPYNPDVFPYFSEILAALAPDDPCRVVTLKKSAQIGGTVVGNIFVLGSMAMDPGDLLYVHPTEDNARRWSKMKLAPMLRSTPALQRLFPQKSRDGSDSVLYKERIDGRGALQISGANSPASLSQVTMRRQVQDDLSKWEMNAAGDPETQADSRSRAHEFAKVLKIGTPLVSPGCRTTRNFEAGSQERYHVPCPHCGHPHVLEWGNMLANLDEDRPEDAHFTCPDCGGVIEEHHRPAMLAGGVWIAENPAARRHHRSFALWSAYSPLQSFETIAREWLKAKGDPASERVFLNDTVGEAFTARGEAPPWESLQKRAEAGGHARGTIPPGMVIIALGLDCQKDRVEWQLVGFGREFRRAVVDIGIVAGHISEEETRAQLDALIGSTWPTSSGRRLGLDRVAIDGNAWTEDVWEWARRHPAATVMMVRGANQDTAPRISQVKRERGRSGKLLKYSARFYNFNTSIRKDSLYRNLAKADPLARGYIALPRGLDDAWYQQLTAERRMPVKRKDGHVTWRWEKDPGQANEALDTHIQAEVAAEKLGVRSFTDGQWARLEAERDVPAPPAQMDIEDLPLMAGIAAAAADSAPSPALPHKGGGSGRFRRLGRLGGVRKL